MSKITIYNNNSQQVRVTVTDQANASIPDATVTFTLVSNADGATVMSGTCDYVMVDGRYVYQISSNFEGIRRGDYRLYVKAVDTSGKESNIKRIVEIKDRS